MGKIIVLFWKEGGGRGEVSKTWPLYCNYVNQQKWQLASFTLKGLLELYPDHVDALEFFGFVSYNLKNFTLAKEANEAILKTHPENPYALKGLHRLNQSDEFIAALLKAIRASTPQHMDSFYDLSIVYSELNQPEKARDILYEGEKRFPGYITRMTGSAPTGSGTPCPYGD